MKGIGFDFIYAKIIFLQKGSLTSNAEEMDLFKCSSVSIIIHIRDLLVRYGVHTTFNVSNLCPFVGGSDDEAEPTTLK